MIKLTSECRVAGLVSLIVLSFFMACAWLSPWDVAQAFFSEEGPIERLSAFFWVATTVLILCRTRDAAWINRLLFAVTCLLFGMREADLHKALTGESFLKLKYYTAGAFTLEKALLACLALTVIAVVGAMVIQLLRFVVSKVGRRSPAGQIAAWTIFLMIATKVADRTPATLKEDFGLVLLPWAEIGLLAFEETGEMLLPILLGLAFCFPITPLSKLGSPSSPHAGLASSEGV